jgi:DNA-binding beta-propeller fold protein YncE
MIQYEPNHPTGNRGVIAVDKIGNQILFLDPDSLQVRQTLSGFAPNVHELAVSPDRRKAFIPIYGDGRHGANPHPGHELVVVDLITRQHIATFDLGPYLAPHGLRWGPGGQLYCVCEDSGVALELDPQTGEQLHAIEIGSTNAHRAEVRPDGSKLYTENEEDRSVAILDLRRHINVPGALAGIGMAPDGTTVVLVDATRPAFLLVDTARDVVVRTVPLYGHRVAAQIARYSPNGRYVVFTSVDEQVASIVSADFRQQLTITTGRQSMDMAFHPNNEVAVIGNQGDGTLTVVDLPRARVLRTVEVGVGVGVESLAYY